MVLGAPMGAGLQEAGGRQGSGCCQVRPRGLQGVPAVLGAPPGAGLEQGGAALSPLCSPPHGCPARLLLSVREGTPWGSATSP